MNVSFRVVEKTDFDILLTLMREFYKYDHIPFNPDIAGNALNSFVTDKTIGRLWLVQVEEEVVGYVAVAFGYSLEYGRDAFLDEIYIRESQRGQGLGRQAIALVEQTCRDLGVNALHLEVERENVKAQKFYRKMGFEDHDRYLLTKWMNGD